MSDTATATEAAGSTITVDPMARLAAAIFGWMTAGVIVSGIVGWLCEMTGLTQWLLDRFFVWVGLILVMLVLVGLLSGAIRDLSRPQLMSGFFVYAVINGLMLSPLLGMFERDTMLPAFGVAGATLGAAAALGWWTRFDLSKWVPDLVTASVGVLLAAGLAMALSLSSAAIGLMVVLMIAFVGLTAWQAQDLREEHELAPFNFEEQGQEALRAAFSAYLIFMGLFILVLYIVKEQLDDGLGGD